MTEQKKAPTIDLKARLGRKTVSSPGGPSIPPPALGSGGIPAPPFASRPTAPKIDASDPYAAVQQHEAAAPQPQAIKIEMSEEVVQAHKKNRSKIIALAAIAAVVGGGVGFAFGSGAERDKQNQAAVQGAQELAKDVDVANGKAQELLDDLKALQSKLSKGEYPEAEVSKLAELQIPFDGTNLAGRGIGRFPKALSTGLINLASSAAAVNDKSESLKRLLGSSVTRKAIEDSLAQSKDPKVHWAISVSNGGSGPWAQLTVLQEPFSVKQEGKSDYKWPEAFTFKQGDKSDKISRYTKGDPMGASPLLIPVDPATEGRVCPADTLFKIAREIRDVQELLEGVKSQIPSEEKTGLLDAGANVLESLKKIGTPG